MGPAEVDSESRGSENASAGPVRTRAEGASEASPRRIFSATISERETAAGRGSEPEPVPEPTRAEPEPGPERERERERESAPGPGPDPTPACEKAGPAPIVPSRASFFL